MKYPHFISFFLILLILFNFGCASQIILNDKNPTPEPVGESTPEIPRDDFNERLESVKTGGFEIVYAFRRKDGEVLTSDDKKYLRENLPPDTNQKQLTSDEKAVIVGSNYIFPLENIDALKKRFKIEDYSPKENLKPEQNTNVNR